ncbi:MAG: GAF domain-containing protein [Gaiellales bacterium]
MTTRTPGAFLSAIIETVASSLELDEVLGSVVRLLTEASAAHACFIYLVEGDDEHLQLRAASEPFEHIVGAVRLEKGEGLAGWAVEHREPAFVAENLLADPRSKHVPELDEERFQSLVSVPLVAKDGAVIGVISAHSAAPREFSREEVDFLVSAASLVASAIENARLYEGTRRRVDELEALAALAETIAGADTLEALLPAAADGARRLLGAGECHLYLIEPGGEELQLHVTSPRNATAPPTLGLAGLGSELRRRRGRLSVPLVAEDELVGLLVAVGGTSEELARALAGQLAAGIRKVRLIERLTERNLVSDFLDELGRGGVPALLEGRAARLGYDLAAPHLVVAGHGIDDSAEEAIRRALPGALLDRRDDRLRGLVALGRGGEDAITAAIAGSLGGATARIGLSGACADVSAYPGAFEEARHALAGAGVVDRQATVVEYGRLGAYRYLLRLAEDQGSRDPTVEAIRRLAEYDAERQTQLLPTLEAFLERRGNITATAEALYVHQNTLRQRLRRIAEVAGIDLRRDDWLMLEIAVKLVRLRET